MTTKATLISFLLFCYVAKAQEVSLPADLRQHALTQYNASLFNPTFTLDYNNPQSVSFWTRWQWQQIDADPTTLFLNYSRKINEKSGFGAGFFQHNTGIYFNTGGVLNYAYEIRFNPLVKVSFGANLFGFQQQLADTRFLPDPDIFPIPLDAGDDFILQLAPGFNLSVENFSLSLASENLFDYNVTDQGANTETADKIFMGMASYDFPMLASDPTAFLRPSIYLRTIPEQDNQIGANALFSTKRYWAQAGYNNFYGISAGIGGSFFNRFSLGALVEFGTSSSLNSKDASFEIVASFFLGNPEERRQPMVNVLDALTDDVAQAKAEEEAAKMKEELEKAQQIASDDATNDEEDPAAEEATPADKKEARKQAAQEKALAKEMRKDSLDQLKKEKQALALQEREQKRQAKIDADKESEQEAAAEALKKAEALAEAERTKSQKTRDSLDQVKKMEAIALQEQMAAQKRTDSIRDVQAKNELIAAQQLREKRQDSIRKAKEALEAQQKADTQVAAAEKVTPQAGEKYEEVVTEDGLEPGFYLIANVFGTKKYFNAFMDDLKAKGIEPGSFLRGTNNYNYAYLKRYNTIGEARRARDSNFDGKYEGKTWIFRVVGE